MCAPVPHAYGILPGGTQPPSFGRLANTVATLPPLLITGVSPFQAPRVPAL
ncbi:hypothetical protein AB0D45_04095 [Streptomyces sp. NPDC048352]|uniref:hypothetical protein n=1 Tax=Streptomyces sp. NPDC048352 TaxID=3154718 RepID=UPI003444F065